MNYNCVRFIVSKYLGCKNTHYLLRIRTYWATKLLNNCETRKRFRKNMFFLWKKILEKGSWRTQKRAEALYVCTKPLRMTYLISW